MDKKIDILSLHYNRILQPHLHYMLEEIIFLEDMYYKLGFCYQQELNFMVVVRL